MDFPKQLGLALLKAQGQLRGVGKDGNNPHFKSKYATLENVTDTIRPVLQDCGVLFIQAPGVVSTDGILPLTTMLIHAETGQNFEITIGVPLTKKDPQGVGSAITYACRYSLMALLGLPPVDDDGESAVKHQSLPKREAGDIYKTMEGEIRASKDATELKSWMRTNKTRIEQLPTDWQDDLRGECQDALTAFKTATTP